MLPDLAHNLFWPETWGHLKSGKPATCKISSLLGRTTPLGDPNRTFLAEVAVITAWGHGTQVKGDPGASTSRETTYDNGLLDYPCEAF